LAWEYDGGGETDKPEMVRQKTEKTAGLLKWGGRRGRDHTEGQRGKGLSLAGLVFRLGDGAAFITVFYLFTIYPTYY